jgi:hypothetical protein
LARSPLPRLERRASAVRNHVAPIVCMARTLRLR